jgi:hypothetical protein
MTGFNSKREAAADKFHWFDCAVHNAPAYPAGECNCGIDKEPLLEISYDLSVAEPAQDVDYWIREAMAARQAEMAMRRELEFLAQPAQEPDMQTGIAYQNGFHDGKQAALAGREWNFCERCGKRTADLTVIHTCTPPQGDA